MPTWVPKFYRFLLLTDVSYKRPVSVEAEEKAYKARKRLGRLLFVLALAGAGWAVQSGMGRMSLHDAWVKGIGMVRARLA